MALRRRGGAAGGEMFAGFADVQEIGTGSLATVYRARELGTNRHVALKLLNVRDASPRAVESFERESVALGALSSHPNIVTLFRTFRMADGRPVLVLELCTSSVAERLHGGGRIPVPEAVPIAIKVAGALETAHHGGILHRDVKPQNILITEFGEPALADFGVAMLQSATQTTTGLFDFTTLHAAPELLEGGATSAATDVYELASTLYHLIAGQSAFRSYDGESPASVILRILRDPVQPVTTPDVPVQLSDLLIRAMSKDKGARPPSAAEFAAELTQIELTQGWPRTQFLIRDARYGPPDTASRPAYRADSPTASAHSLGDSATGPGDSAAGPGDSAAGRDDGAPSVAATASDAAETAAPDTVPVPERSVPPPTPPPPLPPSPPPPPLEPPSDPRTGALVEIDEAESGLPEDVQLPPAPGDTAAASSPPLVPPQPAPAPVAPPAPTPSPRAAAAEQAVYPIPPAAWTRPRPQEDVPVFTLRTPQPPDEEPAAPPRDVAPAAPPPGEASDPMAPDPMAPDPMAPDPMAPDPMALEPRATLRAGLAAVSVDEHFLTERLNLRRNRIPWPHVFGFEIQPDAPAGSAPGFGVIVAVTSRGPVPLKGTRRPTAELPRVHALLAAYRVRAQTLARR